LNKIGIDLAYHNHDAESEKELVNFITCSLADPEHVKLCLDAHWIYRGAGNSQVALFDIVSLYAERIVELHLRQSHNGIWSEVFEKWRYRLFPAGEYLQRKGLKPHVVLEQAIEAGTPHTMNTVEAMSRSS
jgi:inosose dehydratase